MGERNYRQPGRPKPTPNAIRRKGKKTAAERPKPKAIQKTQPQPTPSLRAQKGALGSLEMGATRPRVQIRDAIVLARYRSAKGRAAARRTFWMRGKSCVKLPSPHMDRFNLKLPNIGAGGWEAPASKYEAPMAP